MKKYSKKFWNLARRSAELCQLIELPHSEVKEKAGDLEPENGYVKESFVVLEFHDAIIVGFRDNIDYGETIDQNTIVPLRFDVDRIIEKLNLKSPKPIYYTGKGSAGITAIYAALSDEVCGVFTFGLPEKTVAENTKQPEFPINSVYDFQLEGDSSNASQLSPKFHQRIELQKSLLNSQETGDKYLSSINQAILEGWNPTEPPPLDDILSDLSESKPSVSIPWSDHWERPKKPLKSVLKVIVLSHPDDSSETSPYLTAFQELFNGATRDEAGYLAGGTGLVGVLNSVTKLPCKADEESISKYLDDTLHTVIVVLIDDHLNNDTEFTEWLKIAGEYCDRNKSHLLIPARLYEKNLGNILPDLQNVVTSSLGDKEVRCAYTALLVVHEAYNLIGKQLSEGQRFSIFLSHAKKDGLPLTNSIYQQIKSLPENVGKETFYDALTLKPGENWSEQLRDAAGKCVMLVIRTGNYESRAWCREEFLTAVKCDVPIIVVDARHESMKSSIDSIEINRNGTLPFHRYPVTTVSDGNLVRVVGLALSEGLKQLIFDRDVKQVRELELTTENNSEIFRLSSDVEGLVEVSKRLKDKRSSSGKSVILHQPPPPNHVRHDAYQRIAQSFASGVLLRTCMGWYDEVFKYDQDMRSVLHEKIVGISIAEVEGRLSDSESNHLILHVVERLFEHGAAVVFGHDWREGGIMDAVYTSMRQNFPVSGEKRDKDEFRILNMVPWRNGGHSSTGKDMAKSLEYLKVESIGLPAFVETIKADRDSYAGLNATALSELRTKLTETCNARICIGGKMANTTGAMAGILEEAALAIRDRQPLYLCGHWGGAAGALCDIISGNKEYSPENFEPNNLVKSQLAGMELPSDFYTVQEAFQTISDLKISDLSNGLSEEENKELFYLSDIRQIMSLIIKGLQKVSD